MAGAPSPYILKQHCPKIADLWTLDALAQAATAMPYIGLLASRCLASSTDAELPQQRRHSVLRENLHQCRSKNCAELLTSKEARSSHSNLELRLIVENRVEQRAMDCNAAVVIDEAQTGGTCS